MKAKTAKTAEGSDTKDSVLAKADMPPNLTDGSNKAFDNKPQIAPQESNVNSSSIVGITKNTGYQLQLGAYVSEKDARAAAKQLVALIAILEFSLYGQIRDNFLSSFMAIIKAEMLLKRPLCYLWRQTRL